MKVFLSWLKTAIEDQAGAIDDKRVSGLALVTAGIVYLLTRTASMEVLYVGSALIIYGLACFGLSIPSDRISLAVSSVKGEQK